MMLLQKLILRITKAWVISFIHHIFLILSVFLVFSSESMSMVRRYGLPSHVYHELSENERHSVGKLVHAKRNDFVCTAFIIEKPRFYDLKNVILTAAHCLDDWPFVFFSDHQNTYPIVSAFIHPEYKPKLCSPYDLAIAVVHNIRINPVGLPVLTEEVPSDFFDHKTIQNIGYGLTGRGDINILYQDNQIRKVSGTVFPPLDKRFKRDRFVSTHFDDSKATGIPSYGDCGSPGLSFYNGKEKVISLVSCMVSPSVTVLTKTQQKNHQDSQNIKTYPLINITDNEINSEPFMDSYIHNLATMLNRKGKRFFPLHSQSFSYQIYLPVHQQWIFSILYEIYR